MSSLKHGGAFAEDRCRSQTGEASANDYKVLRRRHFFRLTSLVTTSKALSYALIERTL